MERKRSEKEIQEDIHRLLKTHFGESGRGIKVEVKGDRVSLWGTVDTLAEKNFIGQRIHRIDGIVELDNSLTVASDGKITDKDIQEQVIERLKQSNHEEIGHLGCRVSKGTVTLLGHLEAQSTERLAKRIASQVRGVKEIRSEIQFFEKDVDDATLVNRVEDTFVESPWVNAQQINTTAHKGVITLTGLVNSPEEIEWAVETAYQVPGVKAVVSELLSRHRSQGEDLYLTEQLVRKLGEHGMNSRNVRAFVQGGIAFLSGEVYSDEDRRLAESLSQYIDGIKSVSSSITVAAHSIK
ncbi:MAG: BON domain-containing protein [Desulfitobacterium sp.]|nr:BON domain-containing protein [Desulfitobacterium sp.]